MGGFILTACYYNTMLLILFLTASLVLVTRVRSVKPPFEREELRLFPLMGVVFYSSRNIRPWVFARSLVYLSRSNCLKESEESLERKSGDFRVLRVAWMVSWISLLLELKR